MTQVFHVSAPNLGLAPGYVFGYGPIAPCLFPGADEALARRYGSEISPHGARYLSQWGEPNSHSAEAMAEAVRLAEFPKKRSRFSCWFASESLDDATSFLANYRANQPAEIWRAEADVLHRGNMALLRGAGVPVIVAFESAADYWAGRAGVAPPVWELIVGPGMEIAERVAAIGVQ